jgi:hypothetical protein
LNDWVRKVRKKTREIVRRSPVLSIPTQYDAIETAFMPVQSFSPLACENILNFGQEIKKAPKRPITNRTYLSLLFHLPGDYKLH